MIQYVRLDLIEDFYDILTTALAPARMSDEAEADVEKHRMEHF